MAEPKFTPGPWEWAWFSDEVCFGERAGITPRDADDKDADFQGLWCPAERRVVAVAQDASSYAASFINEGSADARLIAAAPALYEALDELCEALACTTEECEAHTKALRALALADGMAAEDVEGHCG